MSNAHFQKILHKVVLTGGPSGGKTTASSRLSSFFQTLGWKVYQVPETATILLNGGVMLTTLTVNEANKFQENVLKTMLQIEDTFFELARTCSKNCLVICDRGAMDVSVFMSKEDWKTILQVYNLSTAKLMKRYDHVIHMVSAADGAEEFYIIEGQNSRYQDLDEAKDLESKYPLAWRIHPCYDVIDNSTNFDRKINRLIACVCQRVGIDVGNRLNIDAKKRMFLVLTPLPADTEFLDFEDIDIVQTYLKSDPKKATVWLRTRGHKGRWTYIHIVERIESDQRVAVQTQLSHRDYINMLLQKDDTHVTLFIKRRCFIHNNRYYQLDYHRQPALLTPQRAQPSRTPPCQASNTRCMAADPKCQVSKSKCKARQPSLMILETYTTPYENEHILSILPKFLVIGKEVTDDPAYSMFNLSLKTKSGFDIRSPK